MRTSRKAFFFFLWNADYVNLNLTKIGEGIQDHPAVCVDPLDIKFRLSRNLCEYYSGQVNLQAICLITTTSNTDVANTQISEVGASTIDT